MRVAVGADHAGLALKTTLVTAVTAAGHEVVDLGAHTYQPDDDYPDYAVLVARAVADGRAERGLLVCGSGVGVSVAANKVAGIRAGLCHDTYSAHQGVEHDNMNVLVLGARVVGEALATELTAAFLGAAFTHEARHERRLAKIAALERPSG